MKVRPFGFLGPRYMVDSRGRKYYFMACGIAFLNTLFLALSGLAYLRDEQAVSWPNVVLVSALAFAAVIRFVALTVKHGEIVRKV